MSDSQKPREFWVHLKSHLGNIELSKDVYFALTRPSLTKVDHEVVQTIEYSAYDQLMQQAQKITEWSKKVLTGPKCLHAVYPRCGCDECNPTQGLEKALEQFDEFMKDNK